MGPVERFLQRNFIFIRKYERWLKRNLKTCLKRNLKISIFCGPRRATRTGGGGPTVSGDALYDDDAPRNDLNNPAALFGVENPEAYPSKKTFGKQRSRR